MSEKVISPDLNFVNGVIAAGGESLKKCYQCSTCTVVCNVTPDSSPFPRKEMVQAQWGLKEDLFRNPDIWLCHQCSDCTAYCPRGAKPGEVLNAVRKMSLEHYAKPAFLAKMVNDSKYLIALLALPVVLLLGLIMMQDYNLGSIPRGEGGEIVYAKFIPQMTGVDPIFVTASAIAAFMFVMGIRSYWKDMAKGRESQMHGTIMDNLVPVIFEILGHKRFEKCEVAGGRKNAHMFMLYSFIILAVTTGLAASREWAVVLLGETGVSIEHMLYAPMKILGNAGAIAIAIGLVLVIMNRINTAEKAGMGGYYDWLFIGIIVAIAATGILAEVFRLANIGVLAYPTYFAHLVVVFFLFFYAPFSKMAHMVYRTTAMVFARMVGRD